MQAYTGSARVFGAILTAAAATSTATLYDGTDTSTDPIATISVVANTTMPVCLHGYNLKTGLYIVVAGTGAKLNVQVG